MEACCAGHAHASLCVHDLINILLIGSSGLPTTEPITHLLKERDTTHTYEIRFLELKGRPREGREPAPCGNVTQVTSAVVAAVQTKSQKALSIIHSKQAAWGQSHDPDLSRRCSVDGGSTTNPHPILMCSWWCCGAWQGAGQPDQASRQ